MIWCSTVRPPMPESKTPMGLSRFAICGSGERRHLIAQLFFAGGGKTEDLAPDLGRFHAQVNLHRRRMAANPSHHVSIHRDAQRLKVAQLAVRAEHLLAAQKPALRIALAHPALEPGRLAQNPEAQPGKPAPVDGGENFL